MDPLEEQQYRAREAWFDRTIDETDRAFVVEMRAKITKWEADMDRKTKTSFAEMETELRHQIIGESVQTAPDSEQQLAATPLSDGITQRVDTTGETPLVIDHAVQTESFHFNRTDEIEDITARNDNISMETNVSRAHELPRFTPNEGVQERLSSATMIAIIDGAVQRGMMELTDATENRNLRTTPLNDDIRTHQSNPQINEPKLGATGYTEGTGNTTSSTTESLQTLSEPPMTTATGNLPEVNDGTVDSLVGSGSDTEATSVFDNHSDVVTDPLQSQFTRQHSSSTDDVHQNYTADDLDRQSSQLWFHSEYSFSEVTSQDKTIEYQHDDTLSEVSQINSLPYDSCNDKSSYGIDTSISESQHTSVSSTFPCDELQKRTKTKPERNQTSSLQETFGKEPGNVSRKTVESTFSEEELKSNVNDQSETSLKYRVSNPQKYSQDSTENRITKSNEYSTIPDVKRFKEMKIRALFTRDPKPGNSFHSGGSSHSQKGTRKGPQRKQQNTRDVYKTDDLNIHLLGFSSSDDTSRASHRSMTYYSSNFWSEDSDGTIKQNFPQLGNCVNHSSPTPKVDIPVVTRDLNKDTPQSKTNLEVVKNEIIVEVNKEIKETLQELQNERGVQLKETRENIEKEVKELEKRLREERIKRNIRESEEISGREQETLMFERMVKNLEEYKEKLKRDQGGLTSDKELKFENENIKVHCQTINCSHVTIYCPCQVLPSSAENRLHTKKTFHQTPEQFLVDHTSDVEFHSECSTPRTCVSPRSPGSLSQVLQGQGQTCLNEKEILNATLIHKSSQVRSTEQTRPYNMNLEMHELRRNRVPSHAHTQQDAGKRNSSQIHTVDRDSKFGVDHPQEMKRIEGTDIKVQKPKQNLLKYKKRAHKYIVKSENDENIIPPLTRQKRPNFKQVKKNEAEFSDIFHEEENNTLSSGSVKSEGMTETMSATTMHEEPTVTSSINSSEELSQTTVSSDESIATHPSPIETDDKSPPENNTVKRQTPKRQNTRKHEDNSTESTKVLESKGRPEKSRKRFKALNENERSEDQTIRSRMLHSQQVSDISDKKGSCLETADMEVDNESNTPGTNATVEKLRLYEKENEDRKHLVERKSEQSQTTPNKLNKLSGRKPHQIQQEDIKEDVVIKKEVGISDNKNGRVKNEEFEESELDEMSTESVVTSSEDYTKGGVKSSAEIRTKSSKESKTAIDTEKTDSLSTDEVAPSFTTASTETNSIKNVRDTKPSKPGTSRGKQKDNCWEQSPQEAVQQYSSSKTKLDLVIEKDKRKLPRTEEKKRSPEIISDTKDTSIVVTDVNHLENKKAIIHQRTNKITSENSEILHGQSVAEVSESICTSESEGTQFVEQHKGTVKIKPSLHSRKGEVPHKCDSKLYQKKTPKEHKPKENRYRKESDFSKDKSTDKKQKDLRGNVVEEYISSDTSSPTDESSRSSIHEDGFDRPNRSQYRDCREQKSKKRRKPAHRKEYGSDTVDTDTDRGEKVIYNKNTDDRVLLQSDQLSKAERLIDENDKFQEQKHSEELSSFPEDLTQASQNSEICKPDRLFERSVYSQPEQEKEIKNIKETPDSEKKFDPGTMAMLDIDMNIDEPKAKKSTTKTKLLSKKMSKMDEVEKSESFTSLGISHAKKYTKSTRKRKTETGYNESTSDIILDHEHTVDRRKKIKSKDQTLKGNNEFENQKEIYELSENVEDTQFKSEENMSVTSTSSGSDKNLSYENEQYSDMSDISSCKSQDKVEDQRKVKKTKTIKCDVQKGISENNAAEKEEDICYTKPRDIPDLCLDLYEENSKESESELSQITSIMPESQMSTCDDEMSPEVISHALLSENLDNIKDQSDDFNECTLSDVSASTNKDMKKKSSFRFNIRLRKGKTKTTKKEKDAKRKGRQKRKELNKLEKEIEKEKKELKEIDRVYERKQKKFIKKEETGVLKDLKKQLKAERKLEKMQLKKEKKAEAEKKKEAKKAEKNAKKEENELQSEVKKAEKVMEKEEKKLEKLQRNKEKKAEKIISQAEKKEEKGAKKLEKLKEKLEHKEESKEAKLIKKKEKEAIKLESQQIKHEKKIEAIREKALKQLEKDEKKWEETEKNIIKKEERKQIKKERKLEKERWKLIEKRDKFVLKKEKTRQKDEYKRRKTELVQKVRQGMLNEANKSQIEREPITGREIEKKTSTKIDGEKQYTDVKNKDISGLDISSVSNESDSLYKVLANISVENTYEDEVHLKNIYNVDDQETGDTYYQHKQQKKGEKLNLVKEMQKRNIRILETEIDSESIASCLQNNIESKEMDKNDESRNIQNETVSKENGVMKQKTVKSATKIPQMEYTVRDPQENDNVVNQQSFKTPIEPQQIKFNGKRKEANCDPNYKSWDEESSNENIETSKPNETLNLTGTQEKHLKIQHPDDKLNENSKTEYCRDFDKKEKTVEFISEGGYNSWDESEKENVFAKSSFRFNWDERESKEVEFVQEDGYNSWDDSEKKEDDLECAIREIMGDTLDAYESTKPSQVKEETDILDDPILEKLYGNEYEKVCGKQSKPIIKSDENTETDILDNPLLEKVYGNEYENVCGKQRKPTIVKNTTTENNVWEDSDRKNEMILNIGDKKRNGHTGKISNQKSSEEVGLRKHEEKRIKVTNLTSESSQSNDKISTVESVKLKESETIEEQTIIPTESKLNSEQKEVGQYISMKITVCKHETKQISSAPESNYKNFKEDQVKPANNDEIVGNPNDDDSFISSWSPASDVKEDVLTESVFREEGPLIVNGEVKEEHGSNYISGADDSYFQEHVFDDKKNSSVKSQHTDSTEVYSIGSQCDYIYDTGNLETHKPSEPSNRVERIAALQADIRALKGKPPKSDSSDQHSMNFVNKVKVNADKTVGIAAAKMASKFLKGVERYRKPKDDLHQCENDRDENNAIVENIPQAEAPESPGEISPEPLSANEEEFVLFTRVRNFDSDTSLDEDKSETTPHTNECESNEGSTTCAPPEEADDKTRASEEKPHRKRSVTERLRYQIDKRMGNVLSKIATKHLERYMDATTKKDGENKETTNTLPNIDSCQQNQTSNIDLQNQISNRSTESNEFPVAGPSTSNVDKSLKKDIGVGKTKSKKSYFTGLFKKFSKEEKILMAEERLQKAQMTLAQSRNKFDAVQAKVSGADPTPGKSTSNISNTEEDKSNDGMETSRSNSVASAIDKVERVMDRKGVEKLKTELFIASAKVRRAEEKARRAEKKAAKYHKKQ